MVDKLISLKKELKICTTNQTETVLSGWFDTNCESTLNFLDWFTTSINKDNIPTGIETEQFEYLQKEGFALSKEQCELNLTEIEQQYPNITEIDDNVIETTVLRSKLVNLEVTQQSLKLFHKRYISLKDDLTINNNELENEDDIKWKENEAKESCLFLANKFDELNTLFQKEISVAIDFEPALSKYIRSGKSDLNVHFGEIKRLGIKAAMGVKQTHNIVEDKSFHSNNSLDPSRKCNSFQNELSIMNKRIISSLPQMHIFKAKRVQLEAKLKFLEETDIHELNILMSQNDLQPFKIDNNEKSKIISDICNTTKNVVENFANLKEIRNIEALLNANSKEMSYLEKFNEIIKECLSFLTLTTMVCELELEKFHMNEEFIQNFREYLSNYLRPSKEVSAILNDLCLEWKEYKERPLEKNKFFEIIASILSGQRDTTNIFSQINNFNTEVSVFENKYICTSEDVITNVDTIKSDIKQMKKFLQNGPTGKPVIVPFEINQLLYDINEEFVCNRKQLIALKTQLLENTKIINKSKWSRTRFQLWVYFLMDIDKLNTIISNLEQEVNKR